MMRSKLLSIAIFLGAAPAVSTWIFAQNASENEASTCIPAHQFIELLPSIAGEQTDAYGRTTVALGSYERVSPDGRFILRSYGGGGSGGGGGGGRLGEVSLIELSADGQVLRAMDTPFRNEAFPVQGTWRYLVDTNGDYYDFSSLSRRFYDGNSSKAPLKPAFSGGMSGFYAAAAELPSDKPGHIRIRSLSWPNSGDFQRQGEGALASRTLEIDLQRQRIIADTGTRFHCTERLHQDGSLYALPMISVDGQEFAALPQLPSQGQQRMRVFGFSADGKGCELREAFDFSSGKTVFGFADEAHGVLASLAWEYRGQAWWFSRELKRPFNLAPFEILGRKIDANFALEASAFPGITRDGRVIYGATLRECSSENSKDCKIRAGYVASDPYQSADYQNFMLAYKGSARRQCITRDDVKNERAAFAKFHGIAP